MCEHTHTHTEYCGFHNPHLHNHDNQLILKYHHNIVLKSYCDTSLKLINNSICSSRKNWGITEWDAIRGQQRQVHLFIMSHISAYET